MSAADEAREAREARTYADKWNAPDSFKGKVWLSNGVFFTVHGALTFYGLPGGSTHHDREKQRSKKKKPKKPRILC